ncbi:uncharacterized protein LOC143169782 isoform X6 [Aptenodytes patagonicus]|uniref:uncharacterized protein LOC143169782 isoform X6 n=1 Tax=Aptenodytes patagonicus TaxID=9234 RepID=UPI003FA0F2D3
MGPAACNLSLPALTRAVFRRAWSCKGSGAGSSHGLFNLVSHGGCGFSVSYLQKFQQSLPTSRTLAWKVIPGCLTFRSALGRWPACRIDPRSK